MGNFSRKQQSDAPTSDSTSDDDYYSDGQHAEASHLLEKSSPSEESEEKPKYPFSVFFIVLNEFCERFSYYGMKAVLVLYLKDRLGYTDNLATVVYHAFVMVCYFTPVFGAIISDSWLGKFRTIFYISLIYAAGNILLSVASASPLNIPHEALSILGLVLIGLGTGGIKPCVAAFGGDQFAPSQEKQRQKFFSVFYFSINAGSLISIFVTPILRSDVKCFGDNSCFPLAFGVPAALMITSLILFLCGKPLYKIEPPQGTIIIDVVKCVGLGIKGKISSKEKKEHWLDHANEKFDPSFVADVKAVMRVLYLYIPLPIFWALFDQQGSRWTLQAERMSGYINEDFTIKPDQIQVINPVFILALIPIFDVIVYPLFAKCNLLKKSLHRIVVGGFLAAGAFVVAGFVQLALEATYPIPPQPGTTQFNIINVSPCTLNFSMPNITHHCENIGPFHNCTLKPLDASVNYTAFTTFYKKDSSLENCEVPDDQPKEIVLQPVSGQAIMVPLSFKMKTEVYFQIRESRSKTEKGMSDFMLIYNKGEFLPENAALSLKGKHENKNYDIKFYNATFNSSGYNLLEPDSYEVYLPKFPEDLYPTKGNFTIDLKQGAASTMLLYSSEKEWNHTVITSVESNSFSMLWLIPQYFVITLGEIMFSITGLEFSYSQAPASMKSVVQAAWLLTTAFGNAIVIIVAEAEGLEKQSYEFFLFACLMAADMFLFMFMARNYVYVKQPEETPLTDPEEKKIPPTNGIPNLGFVEDTKF